MFADRAIKLAALLALAAAAAFAGATLTIVNVDSPGEGFNEPTPAAPVGGNTGTTVGQQRLIAFQYAAGLWGAKLSSNVEIRIQASFDPLSCTATSATLGAAGTIQIFAAGGVGVLEYANTWYPVALANKLAGTDLAPGPPGTNADDIVARFNSNLGLPGCLTGTTWYYGLDTNAPPNSVNLVTVLLHEFAHGLGFANFVNEANGTSPLGLPDVYSRQTLDTTTGKSWDQMTSLEIVQSSLNARRVVWSGINVTKAVPQVLAPGTPILRVTAPAGIAGIYAVGTAAFGPPLASPGVSGTLVQALDAADAAGPTTTDGCSPIANAAAVMGRIAVIDRGTCGFAVKVKNAQNAGAIAVVIADNAPGSPPAGMAGVDPTIVIPSVRVTQADGNTIKAQLGAGVSANMGVDLSVRSGADAQGRALLFAPNPLQQGSSISHWDSIAFPNQLMEPAINADLSHSVEPPKDLSLPLMRDIGWFSDFDGVPDAVDRCPDSDRGPTIVLQQCDTGVPNVTFTTGCRISDLLKPCAADAKNEGQYRSCVSAVINELRKTGILDTNQHGAVQSCAAKVRLP